MNKQTLFEKIQEKLSKKIIKRNVFSKIKYVCGVDVSYQNDIAFCSAVVVDRTSLILVERVDFVMKTTFPYISGLFMLREAKPIINTLKKIKHPYDLILVDGHGILHPRKCGLACYIGLIFDRPTIGIAKNLLCGKINDSNVEFEKEILGYVLKKANDKAFISIGHKMDLGTAKKIVKELSINKKIYPEPLFIADNFSKEQRKRYLYS